MKNSIQPSKTFDGIGAALVAVLFALVFVSCVHTLTSINQDIGRHLTLGRIIWQTGHVPSVNEFSYTAPDFPFINHHWFAEVLMFLGTLAVGLKGLIVVKAGIVTAAFGLAFFACYRRESSFSSTLVALVAFAILAERTDVRPEMFSFLFLGWYLFVLYRLPALAWSLPLVQVMWVNTHIYFFLGPMLYTLFLVGTYLRGERFSWGDRRVLIGIAILAALFVNPFSWRGALEPFLVWRNYGYSIVENKSPFFLAAYHYPQFTSRALYAGIAAACWLFALNYRQWREHFFALTSTVASAVMALMMVRNFPVFALVMLPAAMSHINSRSWPAAKPALKAAAGIVILGFIYSIVTRQPSAEIQPGANFGLKIPEGAQQAVDFVHSRNLKGPMFNNFDIGSFLIWKMPEEPVFIDGRPEAYPADFIQRIYIPMQEHAATWERSADYYRVQYVFWDYDDSTPWSQKFVARMLADPQWPLVYRDGHIMIFVRNTPDHYDVIKHY